MAIQYDRCIFEILGKLTSQQLATICVFINAKVALLENDIRNKLSITDSSSNQVVELLENLGEGVSAFNEKVRQSALFDVVRTLGPNCGPIADVFGGAFETSELAQQGVEDITFIVRQVTNLSALSNTLLNNVLDTTGALKDICTISQLMIQEGTRDPNKLKETFIRLSSF